MKKFLLMHVVALGILSVSQNQARAWADFKFGVGIGFSFKCGWPCAPHCAPHELPPYVIAPIFYQPPNPDFFISPPTLGHNFVAPSPTPAPAGDHSHYGVSPYYQNTGYPGYYYPSSYGR